MNIFGKFNTSFCEGFTRKRVGNGLEKGTSSQIKLINVNNWILTAPIINIQLKKVSWMPIKRQVLIKYDNSPFNKNLKDYFEKRDVKEFDRNNIAYKQKLAKMLCVVNQLQIGLKV